MRLTSIRLLFELTTELDLEINDINITTAFLNGDLNEEVFMEQPSSFVVPEQEQKVYKLRKAIFALKD